MNRIKHILCFCTLSLLSLTSISHADNVLRMSTTTSTDNSGLLNQLHPVFENQFNIKLFVIAVGTGKALKLGENGDVDVVFVHAPAAELAFVDKGYGIDRTAVMHNDFVIVGPAADPALIKSRQNLNEVMNILGQATTPFVSRGDDSGTHKKEKSLWKAVGIQPAADNYFSVGQGMGAVLKIADEKQAYTLTDRGTYISMQDKIQLDIVFEGDPALFNPYHIMAVNPEKHMHVNYGLAKKYIDFVTGQQGQQLIADYKLHGQPLFYPYAP